MFLNGDLSILNSDQQCVYMNKPSQHNNVTGRICYSVLLCDKGGIMLGLLNYSETTQDLFSEKNKKNGHKRQKQIYFLICESCFWCASALSLRPIKNKTIPKCPTCDDDYYISIIPFSRGHQLRAHLARNPDSTI